MENMRADASRFPQPDAAGAVSFAKVEWRHQARMARSPWWKRLIYVGMRPLLAARARRRLPDGYVRAVGASRVFFSRGMPMEWRRRWGARGLDVSNSTLWIAGTGTGWEVLSWAELRPRRIIATDLFEFPESWADIARHVRDRFGVRVDFRQAPLEDVPFLASDSIDLCASDAVFEHCRDLPAVLAEMHRIVRPGGKIYASYGPLWFGPGGDHFSGRGGLEHVYNHLLLPPADYRRYFEAQRQTVEDFQSGGRYVDLDLFSRLTTKEYVAAYDRAGLVLEELIVQLSGEAFRFAAALPERAAALRAGLAGRCEPEDLLVKANFVRLQKPPKA